MTLDLDVRQYTVHLNPIYRRKSVAKVVGATSSDDFSI